MAIDYSKWNNGIKNNTFYPLGHNKQFDIPGMGETRWFQYSTIKNNFMYDNNGNCTLIDTASYATEPGMNYTITLTSPNNEINLNLPNMSGMINFDLNGYSPDKIKINAPLLDGFSLGDSAWDGSVKNLYLNLKNVGAFAFNSGTIENKAKICGSNLKYISINGGDLNAVEINAPTIEAIQLSGGTFNGEMQMSVNENCSIQISGGTFIEGIFKGMPLTNLTISDGTFEVVNPDPDELQKLDDDQLSWFIGNGSYYQWALKTFLDSLKIAFPNGGKVIIVGYFIDFGGEWDDMKTQYNAAGFTLMTRDEYWDSI